MVWNHNSALSIVEWDVLYHFKSIPKKKKKGGGKTKPKPTLEQKCYFISCWQKQLKWRTRLGNSPGSPGLPTAIIKQTPHRPPPDETTWGWGSHPSHALTLSGEETPKCQGLPCPAPSHPTPSQGKETEVTELGRNHKRTPMATNRGTDPPRDTMGHTPLVLPNKSRRS